MYENSNSMNRRAYSSAKIQDSPFFSLQLKMSKNRVHIVMQLNTEIVNTQFLPKTRAILEAQFPGVLHTACFNEQNLPFSEEVKQTEIGHLFEHILLESLCVEKMALGYEQACFNGRTDWNWQKEKRGKFHIFVDGVEDAKPFLSKALDTATHYTNLILQS